MREILYSGFDTLVFSTKEFHVDDIGLFSDSKNLAGLENNKLYGFSYDPTCNVIIDGDWKDIKGNCEYLMRSTSFNPFAWSFYDVDRLFLFNVVFSETKKIFQVKVLAEAFMKYKSFTALKKVLQEKLEPFGIDLNRMKVKRLDYAVDVSYKKKKIDIWSKRNGFLSSGLTSHYSSLLRPAMKNFYIQDFGSGIGSVTTGFYVGSKSVLLRVYDKVLESIMKYSDNKRKSETILNHYYKKNKLIDHEVGTEFDKKNIDIQYWNNLLLEEYLKDDYQVVRFEFQLKGSYLENKFQFVEDLDIEDVKCLVKYSFTHHSGITPKNLEVVQEDYKNARRVYEKDVQFYVDSLENSGSVNIIKKLESDIENSIIRSVRMIFSNLANLGEKMSMKNGELATNYEVRQYLARFQKYYDVVFYDKMWSNEKVLFSLKKYRNDLLSFIQYDEYKKEYNFALSGDVECLFGAKKEKEVLRVDERFVEQVRGYKNLSLC